MCKIEVELETNPLSLLIKRGDYLFRLWLPADPHAGADNLGAAAFRLFSAAPAMVGALSAPIIEHRICVRCLSTPECCECDGGWSERRVYLLDADAVDAVLKKARGE